MANEILTPDIIAKETTLQFRNALVLGNSIHRDYRKDFDGQVGDTITIRKPARYVVQTHTAGGSSTSQALTEPRTSNKIDKQHFVKFNYNLKEKTLDIDEFSERHIKPAALALANQVELEIAKLYKFVPEGNISNSTNFDDPQSYADIAAAGKTLDSYGVPQGDRYMALNPLGYWDLANGLSTVYNEPINKKIMREAMLGRFGNFDTMMSQNIVFHSAGAAVTAANAAAGSVTTGTVSYATGTIPNGTFAFAGIASDDTFKAGDVFSIDDMYGVNPITRQATGLVKKFVVATDVTAVTTTVNVVASPGVILSGAYQNVVSGNASAAGITLYPDADGDRSAVNHLAYHKSAFALVMVPMAIPESAGWSRQATIDNCSCRLVKDSNIDYDEEAVRIDILYGVKCINPEFAYRMMGSAPT